MKKTIPVLLQFIYISLYFSCMAHMWHIHQHYIPYSIKIVSIVLHQNTIFKYYRSNKNVKHLRKKSLSYL